MSRSATGVAIAAVCGSLASVAAPRSARATGQDLFSFGARSQAMGGSGTAFADDYSGVHANPAGLSRARRPALTLGVTGAGLGLSWNVGRGDEHVPADVVRATVFGLTLPIPLGTQTSVRAVLGVGLYLPFELVGRNRVYLASTPQFLLVTDRAQGVGIQAALGVELPGGWRFGAGSSALSALGGNITIAADSGGNIGWRVDDRMVVSYAALGGISWERGIVRAGVTFRSVLLGGLNVQIVTRDLGLAIPPFNLAGTTQYDPMQVSAEVAVSPHGWTIAAGATLKFWGLYAGPLERTTTNSAAPPSPEFSHTVAPRIGVERRWESGPAHVALRGGYWWEMSPAPLPRSDRAWLDNDRHVLTLGLGLGTTLRSTSVALDVYAQMHLLAPRDVPRSGAMPSPVQSFGGHVVVVGGTLTVGL